MLYTVRVTTVDTLDIGRSIAEQVEQVLVVHLVRTRDGNAFKGKVVQAAFFVVVAVVRVRVRVRVSVIEQQGMGSSAKRVLRHPLTRNAPIGSRQKYRDGAVLGDARCSPHRRHPLYLHTYSTIQEEHGGRTPSVICYRCSYRIPHCTAAQQERIDRGNAAWYRIRIAPANLNALVSRVSGDGP